MPSVSVPVLSRTTARTFITRVHDCCEAIRGCPAPVIARINGYCLGAGLEIAAACDLRAAAETAVLGMPEVLLGIPSVIDAALIERHVGAGRARELILTGEPITAEVGLAWGLVNRVVPEDRLLQTCRALVDSVFPAVRAATG